MRCIFFTLIAATAVGFTAFSGLHADGPADNIAEKVRPVPPPGIDLSDAERQELEAGRDQLGKEIDQLRADLKGKADLLNLLPDVQIFYNAVHYALKYNEFFKKGEIVIAHKMLSAGMERAEQLRAGTPAWTTATGLVVRGYVSKIDGSVQPYGLVVPASYSADAGVDHRLDIWFHGRGEVLSELNFLDGRMRSPGDFTPRDAIVLHPYGRYCNANHFAGEIDTFEAMDHVKKHYNIDDNRIVVRGFSMGGAACWNFAVHYADQWVAAAPGAGFSETPDFLAVFQKENYTPPWYERRLLHWYDCTDWAINLFHCPTVAYSGEKDSQKQAADIMAVAMEKEGLTLRHIIGPGMGHSYHPASKAEINRRIDAIATLGRDQTPPHIMFTTYTLRYNKMHWVTVDALELHWNRARVEVEMEFEALKVATDNVAAFSLSLASGQNLLSANLKKVTVEIDGLEVNGPPVYSDRSWEAHFRKTAQGWRATPTNDEPGLRKRHGLQGPIDDAFMDRFLMVRPTGKPLNEAVGKWAAGEMAHATKHWRQQFRGEAPVKDDKALTDADIASSNLVLWGDPSSNAVLAKIAGKLPIRWSNEGVVAGARNFESDRHVPVLIYPNPLNPKKYVVLNSGFTFREYDYLNNARQIPKLPDWAILDVSRPPTPRTPAGIADAGFFNEKWELSKK